MHGNSIGKCVEIVEAAHLNDVASVNISERRQINARDPSESNADDDGSSDMENTRNINVIVEVNISLRLCDLLIMPCFIYAPSPDVN